MSTNSSPTVIGLRREPGGLTRSLTSLVLRLALGLMFLVSGWSKLEARKDGRYPDRLVSMFNDTILAERMPQALDLYAQALPYAEIGVGAFLVLGLSTTIAALAAGLLLISLEFGLLILANNPASLAIPSAKIPTHMIYLLMDTAILWLSPVTSNYLSVDGLLFGWFWKPKTDQYHVEPENPAFRTSR